jgi:hypothetical protein
MLGILRRKQEGSEGKHDFLLQETNQGCREQLSRSRMFKGSMECASALTQIASDPRLAKSASLIVTCDNDLIHSGCVLKKIHNYKGHHVCILTQDRSGNEFWFATTKPLHEHYIKNGHQNVLLIKEIIVSYPVS